MHKISGALPAGRRTRRNRRGVHDEVQQAIGITQREGRGVSAAMAGDTGGSVDQQESAHPRWQGVTIETDAPVHIGHEPVVGELNDRNARGGDLIAWVKL